MLQRRSLLTWMAWPVAAGSAPSVWAAVSPPSSAQSAASAPSLMLAQGYRPGVALAEYWVSEKLDGLRGYWDGQQLLSRGGQRIAAPKWFTAGWPAHALDGELWAGRGQFAQALSTVRQQAAHDDAWRSIRFMVFDAPGHSGAFNERIPFVHGVVSRIDQLWVQAVAQFKVGQGPALQALLQQTVRQGGEGLMLHRGTALYQGGARTPDLLKMKVHEDAEARVVAHVPGKGKYAGQVGALLVEMPGPSPQPGQPSHAGLRFKLGSGLRDRDRLNPPAVGSWVTYRFRGMHDSGLPRFATFVRSQGETAIF